MNEKTFIETEKESGEKKSKIRKSKWTWLDIHITFIKRYYSIHIFLQYGNDKFSWGDEKAWSHEGMNDAKTKNNINNDYINKYYFFSRLMKTNFIALWLFNIRAEWERREKLPHLKIFSRKWNEGHRNY